MALPIEISVDGGGLNPAAGTSEYHNPALLNQEFYIQQAGFGPLPYESFERIDAAGLSETDLSHGPLDGFRLLNGLLFGAGETYFAYITGAANAAYPSSDYTNGYQFSKVIGALMSRLGWKQPTQSSLQIIDTANLESKSGRYFNDGSFHPLVTIQNIKSTIEDEAISDTDFNDLLRTMQQSVIIQCLQGIFNKPELIEQTLLFDRSWNNDLLIPNGGNFVGIRFKLAPAEIAMQITSLVIYLNQAKTFNLYLYHDTKKLPIWQQSITSVADDATIITPDVPLFQNNLTSSYKSGYFYLGYYQADIGTAQAYDERKGQYAPAKCFGFSFFQAKQTAPDFQRVNIGLTSYNFGLNAEVKTFRDHTVSIIRNAHLFDEVIGLQMSYHTIKQMIYAVRSNRNERVLKDALANYGITYELEGTAPISDVPKSTGLKQRIEQALRSLNQSFFPDPKPVSVTIC